MTNTFYIMSTETSNGTWYMLLIRDSHFCVACGSDLSRIVNSLKSCVKRNRNRETLFKELDGLFCGGKVSPATFNQREKYFREHGEDYADLIYSTVVEALQEAREEDKKNSPFWKTTNRLKKVGKINTPPAPVEESPKKVTTPIQDYPKILRKPKVFNHK